LKGSFDSLITSIDSICWFSLKAFVFNSINIYYASCYKCSCVFHLKAPVAINVSIVTELLFEVWLLTIHLFVSVPLLATSSKTDLGPTQPPVQWVSGVVTLEIKRPGRKADGWMDGWMDR
jgi:hypothetical protein